MGAGEIWPPGWTIFQPTFFSYRDTWWPVCLVISELVFSNNKTKFMWNSSSCHILFFCRIFNSRARAEISTGADQKSLIHVFYVGSESWWYLGTYLQGAKGTCYVTPKWGGVSHFVTPLHKTILFPIWKCYKGGRGSWIYQREPY